MFCDFLEIPKVVGRDDYMINKLEYSLINDVIKKNDDYLLFKKELLKEKPFYYNIFDLSEKIKKDYKEVLYIIIEKDNVNNFWLTIGNTIDINNASYYAKHKVLATDIIENKNTINNILNIATEMLNISKIVIFHIGVTAENISSIIGEQNSKFSYTFDKSVDKYFYYISAKEKIATKIMPYVLSFVAIFLLSTASGMIADSIAEKKIKEQEVKITKIGDEIHKQVVAIEKLKKENSEIEKFSKKDLKIFLKDE